jgi:uncharacterized protein YecT (DUF1311 family)
MSGRLFLSAASVFWAVSLFVIGHGKSAVVADCNYALSHDEEIECEESRLKSATAELDKLYQQLDKVLNAEQRKALRDAHKTWLAYRKAHCYSVTLPFVPGSIVGVLAVSCQADLTNERVNTLRESFRFFLPK